MGLCLRKPKVIIWFCIIFFLCYYHKFWLGLIVKFIGPGLSDLLYPDPRGGSRSGADGDEQALPTFLFHRDKGPIFPPPATEQMKIFSGQVQGQLVRLNTLGHGQGQGQGHLTTKSYGALVATACHGPKILCGCPMKCELGCQIHYMMTCLIISYTTNRTLVPVWKNWPYTDLNQRWGNLFQPLGFKCPIDRDTGLVIWHKNRIEITTRDLLEYPFSNGFTIPEDIGKMGKRLGVDLFHWWAGQFATFALRLHPLQERMISKTKQLLGFSKKEPTVGILVRRRDKIGEKKKTSNSLDKYMTVAKKYFARMESKFQSNYDLNSSQPIPVKRRRIYLATDDKSLVLLARKQYPPPTWEILESERSLLESENIIKDVFLLAECDLVLCSFSSDICRLVSELMEAQTLGEGELVQSLDYPYFYDIPDFAKVKGPKFNLL